MKKWIVIIPALLFTLWANAQVEQPRRMFEMGLSGGINLNRMEFQPSIRQTFEDGINGGIMVRYTSEKYFSMICATQLEVNFAQRGWNEDFDDGTENNYRRELNYVEVPLLARLAWGKEKRGLQFFFNLGPQFGFFLSETEKYRGDWIPSQRPISLRPVYGKTVENTFDYGITGGLGLEVKTKAGNFSIEGRYYYGLADIFGNSKTDEFGRSANQTLSIKLGYSVIIF
ncbi:MAG: PorT family protein [Bacteroidaceae bacterium]|nr:PorT family protein [Bacteroidaceae bacterium]